MPPRVKKTELIDALNKAHGMITGAAEILNVSRKTVHAYLLKWPDAREAIDRWKVRRKDRAEYKLDEAIERGEPWAIQFVLKNALDREYSDRVSVSGGEPLKVIIEYANGEDIFTSPAPSASGDDTIADAV